ncbi:unnamed protein product [Gongylonema pulchrum]|uniref:Transposase n=1 Tax=Gongylonema pulchrum TaxID=637853 RepID=A0A183E107_9BILA|nr:unnamed protein product [Gongylonema pulchrum]
MPVKTHRGQFEIWKSASEKTPSQAGETQQQDHLSEDTPYDDRRTLSEQASQTRCMRRNAGQPPLKLISKHHELLVFSIAPH